MEYQKKLIEDFIFNEYGEEGTIESIEEDIGLAYTEDEYEIPIQINCNLTKLTLDTYVGGELLTSQSYDDLEDMTVNLLEHLSFDGLMGDVEYCCSYC